MALIQLRTEIRAPRERVFDLSRSIDAHQDSTHGTSERAVAGVTSGLIGLGEEITWEARHFGVNQRLSVRITAFDRPNHFQDVMLRGAFKSMRHDHFFSESAGVTLMEDRFEFHAPLGLLGRIAEQLFLLRYMRGFLVERNAILKRAAESDEWKQYLLQTDC
jgi:ligand-binding SRPBCC domain-containing protein